MAGPAARAISDRLPEAFATAAVDLITGPLIENPRRIGKPLRYEFEGVWSARRGTFWILHQLGEGDHQVVVLRVEHRRSAYRRW